jgi:ribonuclease HI
MKAVLYTDGASSGNPGPSGIGAAIMIGGRTVQISEHIGVATNNVAEYTALLRGLEEASRLGATELEAYLDSELLVRQINGVYRVKSRGLNPLFMRCKALLGSFRKYSVRHVPREMNELADRLSKQAVKAGPQEAAPGERHGPQGALPFN